MSTIHSQTTNKKDEFPDYGFFVMALFVVAPVLIFVGLLDNWNERHPVLTVVLTLIIGVAAGLTLVRFHGKSNWKWVAWCAFCALLYGLALVLA